MTPPPRRPRGLTRADLPAEFTPDTARRLGMRAAAQLARPDNGILTPSEQAQFDDAWRTVIADASVRVQDALDRAQRGGRDHTDPELRRSYARTQRRLMEQAMRTREAFPQLDWPSDPSTSPEPSTNLDQAPALDAPVDTDEADADVSVERLTEDLEETSTTLELLDRIATIQQQQLEHQESQLLLDTRGYFFALLVSVAVIVAGVAPLVQAEPHERAWILVWTVAICAVAGAVYAAVRALQRSR